MIVQFPTTNTSRESYLARLAESGSKINDLVETIDQYNIELSIEIQNYDSIFSSMIKNCEVKISTPYQFVLEFDL
jgi:hypothetical protein